jgi:hypothetical protein
MKYTSVNINVASFSSAQGQEVEFHEIEIGGRMILRS